MQLYFCYTADLLYQTLACCPKEEFHTVALLWLLGLMTFLHSPPAASYTGGKERKHRRLRGFSNCHPSLLPFEAQGTKRVRKAPAASLRFKQRWWKADTSLTACFNAKCCSHCFKSMLLQILVFLRFHELSWAWGGGREPVLSFLRSLWQQLCKSQPWFNREEHSPSSRKVWNKYNE